MIRSKLLERFCAKRITISHREIGNFKGFEIEIEYLISIIDFNGNL